MKTDKLIKCYSYLIAALFLGSLLSSCQKDKLLDFPDSGTLPKGLTGSWVEVNTGTDTISFNSNIDSGFFYLSRGFAMTNGYWLPAIGSTAYSYKISGDSISVVDGLSDSMEGGTYYFRFDEPNLTITVGKFSKYIITKKSVLTFRKIK
jgi:hypothetical protein